MNGHVMRVATRWSSGMIVTAAVLMATGVAAQSALVQLGLTETAARTFLWDELTNPASHRGADIVVAGTRAFLKLPRSARAAAASGLFAWARSYVNSPAFTAKYNEFRRGSVDLAPQYDRSVEQEVRLEIDRQLEDLQQLRPRLAKLPADERAGVLEQLTLREKQLTDPAFIKQRQEQVAEERAQAHASAASASARNGLTIPADPKALVARRLRDFLAATADVNFETKTISLTGGPDGIEFVDPAVRTRPLMWLEAVIVGPEATAAARAAAQVWLKENDR